jgi:hypothetical protein
MKKNRGDELILVKVHIYMEILQENSLHSFLYLKQEKMSFLKICFFPIQSENKRAEQVLSREGTVASGREDTVGKGGRRINIVQKLCTYISKCKNDIC